MVACRKVIACDVLLKDAGEMSFLAYDFAQVFVDGVNVAQTWRAGSLSGVSITSLSMFCSHPKASAQFAASAEPHVKTTERVAGFPTATAQVTILVSAYGRENFYTVGHSSEVQKGIIGDVKVHYRNVTGLSETPSVTLTGWKVHAMPLVQPGVVLKWPGERSLNTTQELISGRHRKPFESIHGAVWRADAHQQALAHHDPILADSPTFIHGFGRGERSLVPSSLGPVRVVTERHSGSQGEPASASTISSETPRSKLQTQHPTEWSVRQQQQLHVSRYTTAAADLDVESQVGHSAGIHNTLQSVQKPGEQLPHGPVFYRYIDPPVQKTCHC